MLSGASIAADVYASRYNMDASWSETGDRYLLKLFRDYLFHQVNADGAPWVDMAHVIQCLNKVWTSCVLLLLRHCHPLSELFSVSSCRLKPCPHCRRKVRLSQKSATVAENARQRRNSATVALFCNSLTFLWQSLFSVTNWRTFLRPCGQALSSHCCSWHDHLFWLCYCTEMHFNCCSHYDRHHCNCCHCRHTHDIMVSN